MPRVVQGFWGDDNGLLVLGGVVHPRNRKWVSSAQLLQSGKDLRFSPLKSGVKWVN